MYVIFENVDLHKFIMLVMDDEPTKPDFTTKSGTWVFIYSTYDKEIAEETLAWFNDSARPTHRYLLF